MSHGGVSVGAMSHKHERYESSVRDMSQSGVKEKSPCES